MDRWNIERPDRDYPDYFKRMEYEIWDDDGLALLEEIGEEEYDEVFEEEEIDDWFDEE